MADGPLIPACNGPRVAIRPTPPAKSDCVLAAAEPRQPVKACVIAPAADGPATEAPLRLLARTWRVPHHDLAIVAGGPPAVQHQEVRFAADPRRLRDRLGAPIAPPRGQ